MKRTVLRLLPIIFAAVLITACGGGSDEKPEDTENPVVVDPSSPSTDESNPTTFARGAMLKYTGTFTDNEALKEVTFSLSSLKSAKGTEDPVWEPTAETIAIEGTEDMLDQQIFEDIPSDVYTGEYLLNVVCADAAGNNSNTKSIKIVIE